MGNHYIPRYYLKGFTETQDSDLIWVFDKDLNKSYQANITNVAQENHFYSPSTESYLSDIIEDPANKVIEKIRSESQYSTEDKWDLAKYMSVLLKRVPNSRELSKKWHEEITQSHDIIIDALEKKAEHQFIWEKVLPPEMTPDIALVLFMMKWDILVYDNSSIFFTSDNPIYYPANLGLGDPSAEVTFPISTNIALFASWDEKLHDEYRTIDESIALDVNKRTEFSSTRFLYFSRNTYAS